MTFCHDQSKKLVYQLCQAVNVTFQSPVSEYEPAVNEVEVPVLNRDLCNQWLEHRDLNVTEGMICAGYPEGGKDACQVGTFTFTIPLRTG